MKYRPDIDGLRAVAVLSVILFHAGLPYMQGGFVGVDVFFVISGFLITSLLIRELEAEEFSLPKFYERRARRILPALFIVVTSTYVVSAFLLSPFDFKELSQSIVSVATFSSNLYFFLKTGYFDTSAEMKPLLHTWSLSIEEQFYILFPLILAGWWYRGKTLLLAVFLVIALISLAFSEVAAVLFPSANFYLLPSRIWELMMGAIGALFRSKYPNGVQVQGAAVTGLLLIVIAVVFFDQDMNLPGLLMLLPVVGALLICVFPSPDSLLYRLLSSRPTVGMGLISYSAYLWHQPIFALGRQTVVGHLDLLLTGCLLLATFSLAILTWKFVELPFRRSASLGAQGDKSVGYTLKVSAVSLIVLGLVGYAGHLQQGYPDRNPNMKRLSQNPGFSFKCSGALPGETECMSTPTPRITVWGDSYAMHLTQALAMAYPQLGVNQITLSGCPPLLGYRDAQVKSWVSCADFNDSAFAHISEQAARGNLEMVILSSAIDLTNGLARNHFIATVKGLKGLGIKVVLVSPTPYFLEAEKCANFAMRGWVSLSDCSFPIGYMVNEKIFDKLNEVSRSLNIGFIDLRDFMCNDDFCSLQKRELLILRDYGHLTNEIQEELSKFLKKNSSLKEITN